MFDRTRLHCELSKFHFKPDLFCIVVKNIFGCCSSGLASLFSPCCQLGSCQWRPVTVPIGGDGGRVFKIGSQHVNMKLAAYYNVDAPDDNDDVWNLQFTCTFWFPKGK